MDKFTINLPRLNFVLFYFLAIVARLLPVLPATNRIVKFLPTSCLAAQIRYNRVHGYDTRSSTTRAVGYLLRGSAINHQANYSCYSPFSNNRNNKSVWDRSTVDSQITQPILVEGFSTGI